MSCSPKSQGSTVTCATEGSENGPRGAGTVSHVIRKLSASITSLKKSFSARQHGGSEDLIKWQDIELTTEIGRGALFTVYKGQWAGNKVAVKVLRPELCSAQGMKRLKKEVKLQMARQHRRLARVYGLVSNGQQYHGVVQHLYEGGTLEQLINKQPVPGKPRLVYQDLNLVWRLRLAYQVARAMQHLASVSIVHGDLRTANLLLDSKCLTPQQIQVVVANLGTSRPLQQLHAHASTLCHQTSLAAHSDSQGHMLPPILPVPEGPPGQAVPSSRPSSNVTDPRVVPLELVADPTFPRSQATDVWAFGFVLYEIVTGLKAFKEMDRFPLVASKIAAHVARGNRPAIPLDVPPMISEVMQRCWEANPAARPPFDAIADQLEVAQEVLVRELVARADGTAAQYADTSFK